MRHFSCVLLLLLLTAVGCAGSKPSLRYPAPEDELGFASFYATRFHGRKTASGVRYDETSMTAAHRSLPFGTRVQITNLANGRSVVVTINDRGPFVKGRIIDVSRIAARKLDFVRDGTARVRVEILEN